MSTKRRFFDLYRGSVVWDGESVKGLTNDISDLTDVSKCYIVLKSVNDITNDELLEVSNIEGFEASRAGNINHARAIIKHGGSLHVYDYLRSRRYLLPYMGISVENLVGMGWVKILKPLDLVHSKRRNFNEMTY